MTEEQDQTAAGAGFREGFAEADGFHIRYCEAGDGPALVHLHGAGGLRLTPAHDLLARRFRVIAVEMPGFGDSAENARSRSLPELALTIAHMAKALGLARFNLWGTSFGGKTALWLAAQAPERIAALILEAPAAIRPADARPPAGTPEQMASALYAHPERMPPWVLPDAAVLQKQRALVMRLIGPGRDGDLEAAMRRLDVPTLVLFGTEDRVIPAAMGRHYKELMPDAAQLVLVYDAGHAIGAERPEAFAEIVVDFLERHQAFVISRGETVLYP